MSYNYFYENKYESKSIASTKYLQNIELRSENSMPKKYKIKLKSEAEVAYPEVQIQIQHLGLFTKYITPSGGGGLSKYHYLSLKW